MLYPGERDCDDRREAKAATTAPAKAASATTVMSPLILKRSEIEDVGTNRFTTRR
jgi:hypothetical protein